MRVVAVSAHPDDETMGVGGTLLKHLARDDEVFWIIATVGIPEDWSAEHLRQSAEQVEAVGRAYGFTEVFQLGLPAARVDTLPKRDIVEGFLGVLKDVRPEIVYTVGDTDVHTDHILTFEGLMLALKPFRTDFDVQAIYAYEVASSTEAAFGFRPNAFVPTAYSDVTEFLERKLEIMALYENQIQPDLLPRSVDSLRALARYRGSAVGLKHAEAFRLIRAMW